jgi:hypothetical protein
MRHRDQETAEQALEDWKALRRKVEQEGGDNYEKPVLIKFLDTNTYEVMDRDIVEDEFYVLRRYKLIRELDPAGKDLDEAIRSTRKPGSAKQRASGRGQGQSRGKSSRRRRRRPPRRRKDKGD